MFQIVSIVAAKFIDLNTTIETSSDALWLLFILFANLMVIIPWAKTAKFNKIVGNEKQIESLRKILFIIMPFVWIVLLITVITIIALVGNSINEFKYEGNTSTEFYYTMLPIDVRIFILATFLYHFSYFMFPLHFYFLHKKQYKNALWCFIFSTIIILYGASFFSRWTILLYFTLYIGMFIIVKKTLEQKIVKYLKKIGIIVLGLAILYFFSITFTRFSDNQAYSNEIPSTSIIQDPSLYSIFDYAGQSSKLGIETLKQYNGETMNGAFSTQDLRTLISATGILTFNEDNILNKRQILLKENWCMFIGLPAYIVYDFGLFLALIIFGLYYIRISLLLNNTLTFHKLTLIMIYIQIPLCSIFYSTFSNVIYLLLCYLPIYIFMNIKKVSKY